MRCVWLYCYILTLLFCSTASAQENPPVNEQQLETLTENNADVEIEDDGYLQELHHYINHPIDLNNTDEEELNQLRILTTLQIHNLFSYEKLLGHLVSLYELQAIPTWDIATIKKILPYVSIKTNKALLTNLGKRLKGGEYSLLARVSQTMEQSQGYIPDTTKNYYLGSPQKLFCRFRYNYKGLLQYGVSAVKNAGEQFFKGAQSAGFDFYSAHLFIRKLGIIKALAIGDFTVNFGQGLTQWQTLGFKKSSDVMNIKGQSEVLNPYNSSGKINFYRGVGITLKKHAFEATIFGSYRKIDAHIVNDTIDEIQFATSFGTSGYHRTKSEIAEKNTETQSTYGGNISYNRNSLHVGLSTVSHLFGLPLYKSSALYNKYAFSGTSLSDYSIDYEYTYKNMHIFGEGAYDNNGNSAFVNGILLSPGSNVDMSILYRSISKSFRSLYSSSFTVNTTPNNERGIYLGISIHPAQFININAYADIYSFPWLKYLVDAPSTGNDYLIQLTYNPTKQFIFYTRYRSLSKAANSNSGTDPLNSVVLIPNQNWRTNLNYKINPLVTFISRIEMEWYNKGGLSPEHGFLTFAEVKYKPRRTRYSGSLRLQYFETDSYNSRIYAYEDDVLYSFSVPVFYDKGYRYYLNANYHFSKAISVWFRFAQTIYPDKHTISSGLDQINGNKKTELKLEMIYKFI